jgi:predicted RNA-binding Zn-ribbon protein involved in translation (DUF1610 family)
MKLGRNYVKQADKMSKRWKKKYLVYRCPYCGDAHLTTKIKKREEYGTEVLYITPNVAETQSPFKVGDRLEYVGPPKDRYQNPKDHPSYYTGWIITELRWPMSFSAPDVVFARTSCVEVAHPTSNCGGWRYLKESEWRVLSSIPKSDSSNT